MPISEYTQASILGDTDSEGSQVVIETNGRQIRPLMRLFSYLVDELKLHVTEDGIWSRHVDPANVGMNYLHVYPEAFERYELDGDEFTAGVFIGSLYDAVKPSRKPHKDPVEIRINERRTLVSIAKEYPMGTIEWTDRLLNIDPDSVREEPDLPDLGELLMWSGRVQTLPFKDSIDHLDGFGDHLRLAESDGRMVADTESRSRKSVSGDDGEDDKEKDVSKASAVNFGEIAEPLGDHAEDGALSLFSIDYLTDTADALLDGDIDWLEVEWGEECPLSIEFEQTNEDGDTLAEGAFMLAPRIQSE